MYGYHSVELIWFIPNKCLYWYTVETLDGGTTLLNIGEQMVLGKRKLWNWADYGSYAETELMQMLTLYADIR